MTQTPASPGPASTPTPAGQAAAPGTPTRHWDYPSPLGLGASRDFMTGGAAPLLAGFSIALIGVIAQAPHSIKWPGLSLLLFAFSAGFLTTCVQFGFWARAFIYSVQDLRDWFPDFDDQSSGKEFFQKVQRDHLNRWRTWHNRASWMYDLGIICLAAAVALTLAPPSSASTSETVLRWAATGVVASAGAAEAIWVTTIRRL